MKRVITCAVLFACLAVGLSGVAQGRQPPPPVIYLTAKTEPIGNPPPPAGQRYVYGTGSYTLAAGQTVDKVIVNWYIEGQGPKGTKSLLHKGDTTDLAPANGAFTTDKIAVDLKDVNGNLYSYTAIAALYVQGQKGSVDSDAVTGYQP